MGGICGGDALLKCQGSIPSGPLQKAVETDRNATRDQTRTCNFASFLVPRTGRAPIHNLERARSWESFFLLTPHSSDGIDVIFVFFDLQPRLLTANFLLRVWVQTHELVAHHGYHFAHVHVLLDYSASDCDHTGYSGPVCWDQGATNSHRIGL